MEKEGLITTVVGSIPLENTPENMERAFRDLIDIGIDYPCYPQLVKDMNYQFLSPLSALINPLEEAEDGLFYLSDEFNVPNRLVALEYGDFIINFLKNHPSLRKQIKGTKACLTGPFTLASEIILKGKIANGIKPQIFNEPRAIMLEGIVNKLAEIMKRIGKAYNDLGIEIISMDEPILGLLVGRKIFFHSKEFIIETLNKAISGIKQMSSIHVCGRISPFLRDLLLETETKILDHEFRNNDSNFKIFEKRHFENSDKLLAMGTIKTNFSEIKDGTINDYVEDVKSIQEFVKKGVQQYGKENLIIKPDCGFGALKKAFEQNFAYEIMIRKLKNMVLAVEHIK